mgnify:CR=1 FL=1
MSLLTINYEFMDPLKNYGWRVDEIIITSKDISKSISKT